jgi:pectate lyase
MFISQGLTLLALAASLVSGSTMNYSRIPSVTARQTCGAAVNQLVGYGQGTTGGGSGQGVTVTSCSALKTAVASAGVIRISGTLSGCGIIDLKADTTVIGVGAGSGKHSSEDPRVV